jgi:hypothetical protein
MNQFSLLTSKQEFLQIFLSLRTTFAVETNLAERQSLGEQVHMSKLRMFQVGIRRPTISRTEGQHLVPLKLLRTRHQNDDVCYAGSANLIFPINCHNCIKYLGKTYCGKGPQIFFPCAHVYCNR